MDPNVVLAFNLEVSDSMGLDVLEGVSTYMYMSLKGSTPSPRDQLVNWYL